MDVPGYALITGAGSGIGQACSVAFSNDGAAGVALVDINLGGLAETKQLIVEARSKKGQTGDFTIVTYELDVANEEAVKTVVRQVAQDFGRIDYLVSAAGIAMKHKGGAAFVETSDWKRIMDINLTGAFYVLRETAQIMLKQDYIRSSIDGREVSRGSIVNFGSIQGAVGVPLSTAYAATKHGVVGLTKTASEDYAKDGLRINSIMPGYTETPLTTKNPDVLKAMIERVGTAVPMCRMGKASEIADGVIYLAGGRSSFVTGTSLFVDGGYTER